MLRHTQSCIFFFLHDLHVEVIVGSEINWLQPNGSLGYWYVSMAAVAAKSKAFEKFACEVAVLASRDGIKRSNKAMF